MSAFYLPWPLAAEIVPFCAAAICAFLVMPFIVHARYWEKEQVWQRPPVSRRPRHALAAEAGAIEVEGSGCEP